MKLILTFDQAMGGLLVIVLLMLAGALGYWAGLEREKDLEQTLWAERHYIDRLEGQMDELEGIVIHDLKIRLGSGCPEDAALIWSGETDSHTICVTLDDIPGFTDQSWQYLKGFQG